MFWALTCETGKRYFQKRKEPFCITMAALEPRDTLPENKQVSLMLEYGGKEFLLCTLEYDRVMQVSMSLKFSEGEETYFFVTGEGTIHLSGYDEQDAVNEKLDDAYNQPSTSGMAVGNEQSDLDDDSEDDQEDDKDVGLDVLQNPLNDSDDEEDVDYDPAADLQQRGEDFRQRVKNDIVCLNSDEDDDEDDNYDEDDNEDDEDDDIEYDDMDSLLRDDESEGASTSKKRKRNLIAVDTKRLKPEGKKSTRNAMKKAMGLNSVEKESSDSDEDDDSDSGEDMESSIGHTPMPKKMMANLKNGNQSSSESSYSPFKSNDKGKKPLVRSVLKKSEKYSYTLSSGVQYEDIRIGSGPVAKNGKFLHVYYIGKLENGQVFDSIKEGKNKPFSLRLGKNEVISGWDEGLIGMRTGGKRKLKIPPKMGYGNKKMPGIPPNSTLYFTVELKAVN